MMKALTSKYVLSQIMASLIGVAKFQVYDYKSCCCHKDFQTSVSQG